jgi:hypothetical protein
MRRVFDLERLARVARQQARLTTNPETSEALLKIARQFAEAADDRKAALENCEHRPQPL